MVFLAQWYPNHSMRLCRFFPLFTIAAVAVAPLSLTFAQSSQDRGNSSYQVRELTVKKSPLLPFPPGSGARGVLPIEFRSPDQMTQADRDVEADGEASIRERVRFAGLEFNQGIWSYQQIVCPVFPNHVLLRFTRNNGKGDESVFTASIPRMGEGRVRIIPILRRGYSLFSPAPINALTLAAFNHIRLEEHAGDAADWLGTGLCYAALAGANPQVELQSQPLAHAGKTAFPLAMLEVRPGGGDIVRFVDLSARPHPMEWTLIFDAKGRVRKASRAPAPTVESTPVPPALAGQTWVPVPPSGDQPAANVPAQ